MTRWLSTLAVLALVAGAFFLGRGGWPPEAQAVSAPLGTLQGGSAGDMVSCATTPTKIAPRTATTSARSMMLVPASGGTIYVGGKSVDTTGGVSVCASGCDLASFPLDGQAAYCIASGSAVNVKLLWSY